MALTDAHIIVGDVGGAGADVAMSGDATISNLGAVTIGAKKVLATMIALADAKVLVGDSGGAAAAQTMSGDATMANTGALTIAAKAVTPAKMAVTAGQIVVGVTGGAGASVAMSGDATIAEGGAVSLVAARQNGLLPATLASAAVNGGIPVMFRVTVPDSAGDIDISLPYKILVTDFWIVNGSTPAHASADTIQLKNGITAVSDAVAKTATPYALKRAATLTAPTFNLGATLRITAVKDTNIACEAYVLAIKIA